MQIKKIFIYVFCLFFTLSAQAERTDLEMRRNAAVDAINSYLRTKKDTTSRDYRKAQRDIVQFNNVLIYGQKNGTPTDKSMRLNLEADIDYYADECARNKSSKTLCNAVTTELAKYKKEYGADYKPKNPNYPQVDFEKYTYTLNGKTYDLANSKYISGTPQASTPAAKTTVSAPTAVSAAPEYSCEWDNSLPPRKLLYAPGCSGSDKVCSGFVKCTKNGYKINRLATCSSEYCSDSSATECAKQKGYGSKTVTADGQAASASSGSGSKQNRGGGVN